MRVRAFEPGDVEVALSTLVAAFAEDPLLCTVFADPTLRPAQMAWYMRGLLELAAEHGEVRVLEGPSRGVIAWFRETEPVDWFRVRAGPLPPEVDLAVLLRLRACTNQIRRLRAQVVRTEHLYGVLLATCDRHPFDRPGEALVRDTIAVADAAGLPIVLETTMRANLRYFRRMGWEVAAADQLRAGPPFWLLVRERGA